MQLKGVKDFSGAKIYTISISDKELRFIYDEIYDRAKVLSAMQSILTDDDKERYKILKLILREVSRCLEY